MTHPNESTRTSMEPSETPLVPSPSMEVCGMGMRVGSVRRRVRAGSSAGCGGGGLGGSSSGGRTVGREDGKPLPVSEARDGCGRDHRGRRGCGGGLRGELLGWT